MFYWYIVIFIKLNLDLTNDRKFVKKYVLILFLVYLFKFIGIDLLCNFGNVFKF